MSLAHDVPLTNLDRVLWPATATTKGDLVAYYREIAAVLVPHLRERPLMLGRRPEGVGTRGWGQFECRGHPAWMATYPLRLRDGRVVDVCLVDDGDALVWLANQGVVELHPYLARTSAFDRPTVVVFDLDPGPPAGLAECARVALLVRDRLVALGLRPAVKTSGGLGLHVVAGIHPDATFAETKALARRLAWELSRAHPELVVDRMARADRAGRVFIDWAQNDERKQTVAPYSVRAGDAPVVSTPLDWDEVASGSLPTFTMADVLARVRARGDLFRATLEDARAFPGV